MRAILQLINLVIEDISQTEEENKENNDEDNSDEKTQELNKK